jgi:Domain of unknown function (DUF4185)
MARMWLAAALAGTVVATSMLAGQTNREGVQVPAIVKAESAPQWNAKFAGKEGWIGGDGMVSATLGPKRVLWLFGDTILGTAKDGKRVGAKMVNNTVAVQDGYGTDATIRFIAGPTKDGKPTAFITPADGTGWFWPQSAIRVEDRLFVFLPQIEKTKDTGVFGFKQVGQWLASIKNPDDEPENWRLGQTKVPFADFKEDRERSWGSAVLEDGGNIYVYGYDQERGKLNGKRRLTVARVSAKDLANFGAWRFLTVKGWSDKPADATFLADGLATEFSVSRLPEEKGYVVVYTENGLGDRIVGRFSETAAGPWSDPVLLYKCPEMAKDKGVFSYAGKAHAWAASGNELLISYCVNTWEFARLFRDDQVYRPKFVRVQLGPSQRSNCYPVMATGVYSTFDDSPIPLRH